MAGERGQSIEVAGRLGKPHTHRWVDGWMGWIVHIHAQNPPRADKNLRRRSECIYHKGVVRRRYKCPCMCRGWVEWSGRQTNRVSRNVNFIIIGHITGIDYEN